MVFPWWLAALLANLCIMRVEAVNRGATGQFWETLPYTAPFILLGQVGLFYCWKDAPTFLTAWVCFTSGNLALRLLSTYLIVGEPLSIQTWLGTALVFAGALTVASARA